MHLGTLISRLECEEHSAAALDATGDIVLYAETADMAARLGESPQEYAAAAVSRFAHAAEDEEWVGLIGALERAEDPARTALARMLRWALRRDAREIGGEAAGTCASCAAAEHDHGPT